MNVIHTGGKFQFIIGDKKDSKIGLTENMKVFYITSQ